MGNGIKIYNMLFCAETIMVSVGWFIFKNNIGNVLILFKEIFSKIKSHHSYFFIILIVIILSYFPNFSGDFLGDDFPLIRDNDFIREFHSPIFYLSQEDGIKPDQIDNSHLGYFRPLINFSYTLDYKIWGMKAVGFKITNLVLHLLTCFVLYYLLRLFFEKGLGIYFIVLFFGLHPANTESVSWIASRNNILVTLFGLSSFYFYVKNHKSPSKWLSFLCILCFTLSLLSKEFAVMLLPIFLVYDRLQPKRFNNKGSYVYGYIIFTCIIIAYMLLKINATQAVVQGISSDALLKRIYFAPFLIIYNLRILFLPYSLHNFYITYPGEYFGYEAVLGFITVIFLLGVLWKIKNNKIVLFSMLAFLIGMFPVLNIIPMSTTSLVSMRWIYFPASFLCIAMTWMTNKIVSKNRKSFSIIIMISAVIYLGSFTYILNENLWKNRKIFFEQEVKKFDNEYYFWHLSAIYQEEGNDPEAYKYVTMALQSSKQSQYNKIAINIRYAMFLIERKNRPAEALYYLELAEKLGPSSENLAYINNNKGVAYYKLRNYDNSIKYLLKALISNPTDKRYLVNLGNAYFLTGDYHKAISIYLNALKYGANEYSIKKFLGKSYMKMNDYLVAEKYLEEIPVEIRKSDPEINNLLEQIRKRPTSTKNNKIIP